ncbi:MAG: hypothetical protein KGH65_05585 [Candidatus Micrarchaeota archaeon]|nr:hypothetical protein [Candidatus Micrarchaeota archaeon]
MFPLIIFALLAVSGYGHDLNYSMTDNGNATGAILDKNTNTLLIDVSAPHSGLLAIELPRNMIDTNSTFLILNDGNMTTYKDILSTNYNVLVIPYQAGDERITITGTYSAPEFMPALVMTSIISMVILLGRAVDGHWAWN